MQPVSEDKSFWLDRWDSGEIGFHRATPHPSLEAHWTRLSVPDASTVFVPLCGKSHDLHWLAQHGHNVIGVELSRKALEDFFNEAALTPTVTTEGSFEVFRTGRYTLYCGDAFDCGPQHFADVHAVYDRASLVALPPDTQSRFAKLLSHHMAPKTPMLLVSLDYDPDEMTGPPFSTPPDTVAALFGTTFVIEHSIRAPALEVNSPLRQRGLTDLHETCYVLRRKPA